LTAQYSETATANPSFLRDLRAQIFTWFGIVGGAITLFSALKELLHPAGWTSWLVEHWSEWAHIFWRLLFSRLHIAISRDLALVLSFSAFSLMITIGINVRHVRAREFFYRLRAAIFGIVVLLAGWALTYAAMSSYLLDPKGIWAALAVLGVSAIGMLTPIVRADEERAAPGSILVATILYLAMLFLMAIVPFGEFMSTVSFATFYIPILWMLVITLNPLDQLARRLMFLSIGVLVLVGSNELSTFDFHRFVDTLPK
jgi:hypothetical protein